MTARQPATRPEEGTDTRLLSDACLRCALDACSDSPYASDQRFARMCAAELRKRQHVSLHRKSAKPRAAA